MSDNYAGLTALQENVIKTKEHVEGVRSALDTAKQNVFQYTTMVSPSADQLNRVVQFVGNTDSTYTHGYFYTCESDGSGGYQWTEIEFGSIGNFLEEVVELPTATASNVGHTYLLVAPQTGYKVGGIYQCQSDGEPTPTYSWVLISANPLEAGGGITLENDVISADTNIFHGTRAQYEALSADDKKKYSHIGSPETVGGDFDIYSTSETKTNKVWIDGKPIYRKVIEKNVLLVANSWNGTGIDVSEIDALCNCVMLNNNFAFGGFYTQKYSNLLNVYCVSNADWNISTFILEYTKAD